ncbi:hypothetical protein JYT88_01495 [Rhodospirillaceae bacterium AH-315-P19]|nr:hypothetical protein [Rhodospirillaceae bacterium AH-315-P19]
MLGAPGTLPVGASAFSPAGLSGLKLWLAGNRSPFTLNSGNVSQWDDLSGHANHATQATAILQPAYVPSGIAGLPGVKGDGTDDLLTLPTAFNNDYLFDATVKSVFVAIRTGSATQSNKRIFIGQQGSSSRWGLFLGVNYATQYAYRTNVPTTAFLADGSIANLATNTNYILCLRQNGASIEGYANSLTPTATASDGSTTPEVGAYLTNIGGPGANVTISEIIVTSGADPSDAQVQQTLNYLANKYGGTLA